MNKDKHFSCKNCKRIAKTEFSNQVIFCYGLVKNINCPEDYYRFCIEKNKIRNANDIMLEELQSLLMGLSQLMFLQRLKEVNKEVKK